MVVVACAAASAGSSHRSNLHPQRTFHEHSNVRSQRTFHEHEGCRGRHHRSDSVSDIWASEGSNAMSPDLHQLKMRASSRWFLDTLSQKMSESDRKIEVSQHWLVDSSWFNAFISAIVVANTIQIGLAVDITHGSWESFWSVADIVFAALFGLEMTIKVVVKRLEYFKDKWNLLDFLLASMAIIEVMLAVTSTGNPGMAGNLTIFRTVRLIRLLRMLRLFQIFKQLIILMQVIMASLNSLAWLLVLVGLMLYVTAIICVELIGSNSSYPSYNSDMTDLASSASGFNNFQYFGTVIRSMFSLFSLITLSEWSTITRPIAEHQPAALIILILFAMLTAYGVMNVIVGVMVEHALTANSDFAEMKQSHHKETQMEIIRTLASMLSDHAEKATGNADITLDCLTDAINSNTSLAEMLTRIDLPANCSVTELFTLIDDNGNGRISQDEFEATMYRLLFCGEFQRSCVLQISLNTLKRMLTLVQEGVESIRKRDPNRCSLASSQELVQKEDGNKRVQASMQQHNSCHEINMQVAFADEFFKLRMELQRMRFEFGARLAEIEPRWRPPQAMKLKTAPEAKREKPCMSLASDTLHMDSSDINADEADVNDAPMPAVVPGLPFRLAEAASLLRQLDDLVGGLEQHWCEPELATRITGTATETDGHAMVRLRCAHLISRLAQTLAGGRNTNTGSSNVSRSLEWNDKRDKPPNTWDTPEAGLPLQSVWAMKACFGDRSRLQPARKL